MSGLLRRSKSTRDARAKLTRDQLDFNFAQEIKAPVAAAAAAAATAIVTVPNEPTSTKLLKLARRKSVSSFHTTLRIAHVADGLPKTADPNNRQSILYRADSTSPVPPLPEYPPRSSSKMSNYGVESSIGLEGDEGFVIGMAIGSPTEIIQHQRSSRSDRSEVSIFPPYNIYSNDAGSSSTSRLPNKPFEVQVKGPVASGARKTLRKERGQEEEKIKGGKEHYPQEDAPKTGWRKMFGKGFFGGKRASPPRQQDLEPVKKLELVTRDKLSPHLAPKVKPAKKGVSPAPCLNVDIPEVEMERYSVMFGTLLHPSEKSTIFARRKSRDAVSKQQASGQKQDPSQLYLTPLKRNATTGQVCRSPALMLEVSPLPSVAATSRTPSPSGLARSKTTSEAASPPGVYMVHEHSRQESDAPKTGGTPRSLAHSRSLSKISKISEESSIDTPRGSFDEGDDEWMTKEDDGEPQWEMVTKSSDGPMTEDQIQTAAQISIARQISISQRQLLIPIVPKSQRLVSRAPIRKAMVNPKLPIIPPHHQQQEQKKVEDEQKVQLGLAQ